MEGIWVHKTGGGSASKVRPLTSCNPQNHTTRDDDTYNQGDDVNNTRDKVALMSCIYIAAISQSLMVNGLYLMQRKADDCIIVDAPAKKNKHHMTCHYNGDEVDLN